MPSSLPEDLQSLLDAERGAIESRLSDFRAVPRDQWFYELCFCICTPQSSALHAHEVTTELQRRNFLKVGGNVEPVLRNPACYIRFHTTKSRRLHLLRENWSAVDAEIAAHFNNPFFLRKRLVERVHGFGFKEASHALRNIGLRGLAILDRHLLRNLVACRVFEDIPSVSTEKTYLHVEQRFTDYSAEIGVSIDVLDLLFWRKQTGFIFK